MTSQIDIEDIYQRAVAAIREKRQSDAVPLLQELLKVTPCDGLIWKLYGVAVGEAGDIEESVRALRQAVAYEPYDGQAWGSLGAAYGWLGEYVDSRFCYDKSLQFAPDMPSVHWNRSLHRLMAGEWAEGWAEYEWGVIHRMRDHRTLKAPWRGVGQPESLFLWSEQGFGDTLQFLQLIALLRKQCPKTKIVLEVQPELISLLADQPFLNDVLLLSRREDLSLPVATEAHCCLMSLPYALRIHKPEELPVATGYLKAPGPPVYTEMLKEPPLRVGICWKGSAGHANAKNRDIPRNKIVPLMGLSSVRWTTLQQEENPDLRSWADTANVIDGLDMVISCDTAVAHLSAAMSKPTWILIPKVQDFRWLLDRSDSPWYPSVRLFRQEARGEWGPVIEAVKQSLCEEADYTRTEKKVQIAKDYPLPPKLLEFCTACKRPTTMPPDSSGRVYCYACGPTKRQEAWKDEVTTETFHTFSEPGVEMNVVAINLDATSDEEEEEPSAFIPVYAGKDTEIVGLREYFNRCNEEAAE